MTGIHICRSVRGFLFDLDGTLIDSCQIIISSLQKSLRSAAGVEASWKTLAGMTGQPLNYIIQHFQVSHPDRVADYYRRHFPFGHKSKVFSGVTALLQTLSLRGYELALVTTRPDYEALAELDEHGISHYFSAAVTGNRVHHPKPHPEPVVTALHMLNLEPGEAVMVGDSGVDIEAGRRAGTWTGLAGWGDAAVGLTNCARPDFVWRSPQEIIQGTDDSSGDSSSGEGDRGD